MSGESMERLKLTSEIISSFEVARVHGDHEKAISCLDYSENGKILVSSSGDNTINVYNSLEGTLTNSIDVNSHGAGIIRFIQDQEPSTIITSSTINPNNHDIRALDIERKQYVRYFKGHTSKVNSMSCSPVGPQFISSSNEDSYIRIWDCRKKVAIGKVKCIGNPLVSYDPKGLIFGIVYNSSNDLKTKVKLYDTRNFYGGPFLEFILDNKFNHNPNCFKFSSDGDFFIVNNSTTAAATAAATAATTTTTTTSTITTTTTTTATTTTNTNTTNNNGNNNNKVKEDVGDVYMYDAYKGFLIKTFKGHKNCNDNTLEASFSPDSKYIASGSDDGSILIWDVNNGKLVKEWKESHAMASCCVLWNPAHVQLATGCQNLQFWLPGFDEDNRSGDGNERNVKDDEVEEQSESDQNLPPNSFV